MKRSRRFGLALMMAAALGVAPPRTYGQTALPVFVGDTIDTSTGAPYQMLPGLPLLLSGDDEVYGTTDDVLDQRFRGDVDIVVRARSSSTGGPIPSPHPGVGAAPMVIPGGTFTGAGTEVPFRLILSDGATSSPAGNALTGAQHDGRGALVVAFPDLDGDGIVGPTNADGAADNQIELQEALVPAGRQVGVISGGVAAGTLGVDIGAPAGAGGLGLVLVGGALMGATAAEHYFDGPWIATLTPFMPPVDPTRIIGRGNVRPPDPVNLVEVDLSGEHFGYFAPNHPTLGPAFAIPLDGTSATVDIVRSEAGAPVGARLGRPVDVATFVADPTKRLLPAVAPTGARQVVETVPALALADDGPGNPATLLLFIADRLGNPTDTAGATTVVVEVGPALALIAPDTDGDLRRESIVLQGPRGASIVVDDAGGSRDGGAADRITAVIGGVPTDSVRATFTAGGGTQTRRLQLNRAGAGSGTMSASAGGIPCGTGCTAWPDGAQVSITAVAGAGSIFIGWSGCGVAGNPAMVVMTVDRVCTATFDFATGGEPSLLVPRRVVVLGGRRAGEGRLIMDASLVADPVTFDPQAAGVTVTLRDGPGVVFYSRTVAAGSLLRLGERFVYRDPGTTADARATIVVRRSRPRRDPRAYRVRVTVKKIDLGAVPMTPVQLTQTLDIAGLRFEGVVACAPNARGTGLLCEP